MIIRRSAGEKVFDVFNIAFMIVLMIATLYPFLYVAFASISQPARMVQHQGILWGPLGFSIKSYKLVFQNPMILRGYGNTILYMLTGTVLNVFMTALGAYVLSRKGVYFRNLIMFITVFTMFFSGGLIPFYLVVRGLGMADKIWALILPTAISTYNLIIMRTAFAGIPDSMEESAKIDGANDFIVLFRVIIPLSMPVVAVMILFYGVGHWNAWFNAMIFLKTREMYPLQLILREILIASSTDSMTTSVASADLEPVAETVKYATIMVATLPILFVYPFLQKYFVQGIMIGALKE